MSRRHRKREYISKVENGENEPVIEMKDKKIVSILDSSLMIAIISVLGYYITFSYKKGFMSLYGADEIFINQINIVNVIIAITVIGGSVLSIILMSVNFYVEPKPNDDPFAAMLYDNVIPILILSLILQELLNTKLYICFLLFSILFILWKYLNPFMRFKEIKGYSNKMKQALETEVFNIKYMVVFFLTHKRYRYMTLLFVLTLVTPLAKSYGYNEAKQKTDYMILKEKGKTYLVIDNLGDNFIICPFDVKEKKISQEYQLIEIKSDLKTPYMFKKIIIDNGVNVKKTKEIK